MVNCPVVVHAAHGATSAKCVVGSGSDSESRALWRDSITSDGLVSSLNKSFVAAICAARFDHSYEILQDETESR